MKSPVFCKKRTGSVDDLITFLQDLERGIIPRSEKPMEKFLKKRANPWIVNKKSGQRHTLVKPPIKKTSFQPEFQGCRSTANG